MSESEWEILFLLFVVHLVPIIESKYIYLVDIDHQMGLMVMVKSEDLERYPFTQLILIDHNKEKKIELQNTKDINIGLTAFCNFKFLVEFLNFHQIFHQ